MILPTKRVTPQESLLGVGAILLRKLQRPMTVTDLWELAREDENVETFRRFVLSLDILYSLELIDYERGRLRRDIE